MPDFKVGEVMLKNFRFDYKGGKHKTITDDYCINFSDISASGINAKINKISMKSNTLTCRIQNLACKDKSGFEVKSLKGDFTMGDNEIRIDHLYLDETYSTIKANYLSFGFNSGKDFSDFLRKVVMSADFTDAFLDFRTLGKISPALKNSKLQIVINGVVKGTVSDLRSDNLVLSSINKETTISVSTILRGIPDMSKFKFTLNIKNLYTKSNDLSHLIASFSGGEKIASISNLSNNVKYHYSGIIFGELSDFLAKGVLKANDGILQHNVYVKNKKVLNINGNINTSKLDIGAILGNNILGQATLESSIKSSFNKSGQGGTSVKIDSLRVKKLGFYGYNYSNIYAVGNLRDNTFDGRLICHDPNLDFIFQGLLSMPGKNKESKFNFYFEMPYSDLSALNLDKKNKVSQLSLKTIANVSIDKNKNLLGNIDIRNIQYTNDHGENYIKNITLHSLLQENFHRIDLTSPFITAKYVSSDLPSVFIERMKSILIYDQFSEIFQKGGKEKDVKKENGDKNGYGSITIKTYNMKPICAILSPSLYIADSSSVLINLDQNNKLSLQLNSKRIGLNNNNLKNLSLSLTNPNNTLLCNIDSDLIKLFGMNLTNNKIGISSTNGKISMGFKFNNLGENKSQLDFSSNISFNRDSLNTLLTNISINKSLLVFRDQNWEFSPSTITLGNKYYSVENFSINNKYQKIEINGKASTNPQDKMKLNMQSFDISLLNSFLSDNLNIKGLFTGTIDAENIFGNPSIIMDITGEDLYLSGNKVGRLDLMSKWDQVNKRINILINNKFEQTNPINIIGYYKPDRNYLEVNASFQELPTIYANPFLKGVMNISGGSFSGDIMVLGNLNNLKMISDNSRLNNFAFSPDYTKVPYILNGPIRLNESGIELNDLIITDQYNHKGTISGNINHKFFKDMYLDTKLILDNLHCLHTTQKDNDTFYGEAFGSGVISVSGPINDLYIEATYATKEKTSIHIPMSSASSATSKELLTFSKPAYSNLDPYDPVSDQINNEKIKEKSKIEMRIKASITNDAELFLEINKDLGDVMKCKGSGILDLAINPTKNIMDIRGDYTISEGSYRFVLFGLTAKDFTLKEGGNIAFNGSFKNTNINIGATYRTKASVSTLISDISAVENRRNVFCGLNLKGALTNPEISFEIDIPDLDPITKGRVEGALSSPNKIQRQFMALLISGSFVPDEQSSIVNNTTILYSNASEILSNQFNNIFRQLDIPLDLALNYQKGQDNRDKYDFGVSYQAFNNRVLINGNVGNRETSSNWMGNVEVEVKIDKKGKMRVTLFSRAADDYSNYLDKSQRSGFGFSFQDEFNTGGDFWRSIFWSRKKKEEYEVNRMLELEKELEKDAAKMKIKKEEVNKPKEDPLKLNNESGLGQYYR